MIGEALKEPKTRAKTRVNRLNKKKRLASKKAHGEKKAMRGKIEL